METTTQLPPHLQPGREIHVVISILSGQHHAQAYYDETLKPFLDSHNIRYSTHATKSTQTIIDLTRSLFIFNACKGIKQTIILLSGDGGMVDIVNTIATTLQRDVDDSRPASIFVKPVICLFPQGTANALAWSSGVATDPLGKLMTGRAKDVPIFEVTFSPGARLVTNEGHDREVIVSSSSTGNPKMYGAVVFSWGLHASLVAKSDTTEYRKHGLERFKMAAEKLMEQNHCYNGLVRIKPDSSNWEPLAYNPHDQSHPNSPQSSSDITIADSFHSDADEPHPVHGSASHAYILATLVSNLEEHYLISPASKPDFGQAASSQPRNPMHLVAIPHISQSDISRIAHLPYQKGAHIQDPDVRYQQIDGLQIDFLEDEEEWREVCIDGKIVAVEKGGWVEVRRVEGRRVVELVM